jgi:hypothetical protein
MKQVQLSQAERIVQWLLDGNSISYLDALNMFGVGSGFGARMQQVREILEKRGHGNYILLAVSEKNSKNKGNHNRYFLKGFRYDTEVNLRKSDPTQWAKLKTDEVSMRLANAAEWTTPEYFEKHHIKMPDGCEPGNSCQNCD